MSLSVVTAATEEPLSVGEAKHHLRQDAAIDDDLIEGLISSARALAETYTRRVFVTQTLKYSRDLFPDGSYFNLPVPPVSSVTAFQYYDSDGTLQSMDSTAYISDTDSEPARICLARNHTWPVTESNRPNAVQVTFVAGYGGAVNVPKGIKSAMLLMIGSMYEYRSDTITGTIVAEVPLGAKRLLDPFCWGSYV